MGVNNTTCDIYRSGNAPPAAPDVSAVSIQLGPDFEPSHRAGLGGGAGITTPNRWTHIAILPPSTDIRDGYQTGSPNSEAAASGWDTIYVPDKNGTPFLVIFTERIGYDTGNDIKRAYLQRGTAPWPTNNL